MYPGYTEEATLQILGSIFLLSFFLFIIFLIAKKKANLPIMKVFASFSHIALTFGLVGFLWLFFLYEETPVLGARFWFLAIIFSHLVWLGRTLLYLTLQMPKEKEERENRKVYRKYLP